MKYLYLYEKYNRLNEGGIRKFFTGHKNSEDKEKSKTKIINDIDDKIKKLISEEKLKESDSEKLKQKLLKQAKDNNWKGKVVIRKSAASGKSYLVYDEGTSSLQDLGKAASSGIK